MPELAALQTACKEGNVKMANKQYCAVKKKQLKQFMQGTLSEEQVEEFMRRKLENKVRSGLYH